MTTEQQLLGAIVRGVFVGATIGVITKFVIDKENWRYAGTGALIGAVAFGVLYAVKK